MKILKVKTTTTMALLATSTTLLTGCMLTSYVSEHEFERKKNVQDQVIAIGMPATPLKDYPNAIILAGNKYSYIARSDDQQTNFTTIFKQVDLQYLFIGASKEEYDNKRIDIERLAKPTTSLNLYIEFDTPNETDSQNIGFSFLKPQSLLKANERANLEQLGFRCFPQTIKQQNYLGCIRFIKTKFNVAKRARNLDSVPYKLKQPIDVKMRLVEEKDKIYQPILLPLALAVDIVTFPIQLAIAPFTLLK